MFCTEGDSGYRWGGGSGLAFYYVNKNSYCFLKAEVPYEAQDSWNWMLISQPQPILGPIGVGTGAVRGKVRTSFQGRTRTQGVGLEDELARVK